MTDQYADSPFNHKVTELVGETAKMLEELLTVKLGKLKRDVASMSNGKNSEQLTKVNEAIQELELRTRPVLEKIRQSASEQG